MVLLQRSLGNRAVHRILARRAVQAKLRVGPPGDRYERQADELADRVMRAPDPRAGMDEEERVRRQPSPGEEEEEVRRQAEPEEEEEEVRRQPEAEAEEEEEESDETLQAKGDRGAVPRVTLDLQARIGAMRGGGRPLPSSARSFFGRRLGHDFGRVRVHTDPAAAQAAKQLRARAFTVGRHVAFAAGEYAPDSPRGLRLLAHELVHTLQQGAVERSRPSTLRLAREDEASAQPTKPGVKRRGVITFIMGSDVGGFYDYAKQYWGAGKRADKVVDSLSSLQGILDYLKGPKNKPPAGQPWGEINIVVHGAEGSALMPVETGGRRSTTAIAVKVAMAAKTIEALPDTVVDDKTNVTVHGCEIGRGGKLLETLKVAFGGKDPKAPKVYAPKLYLGYGQKSGGPVKEYLLAELTTVLRTKNVAKALKALRSKYSWLPKPQKGRIKASNLQWTKVGFDPDRGMVPLTAKPRPLLTDLNEVKVPKAEDRCAHAKFIRKEQNQFAAYLPSAKAGPKCPAKRRKHQAKDFDIKIVINKLPQNIVQYRLNYTFYEHQTDGKTWWRNPLGSWKLGVEGESSAPRKNSSARWKWFCAWVGTRICKQYRWKFTWTGPVAIRFGQRYTLSAEGTGFQAKIPGVEIKPGRKSVYWGKTR